VTGQKELLFDATDAKPSLPKVRPLAEQSERESRKLWEKVLIAIHNRDHAAATDEKTIIEEMQREEAAARAQDGKEWHSNLFRPIDESKGGPEEGLDGLDWILATQISSDDPKKQAEEITAIIPIVGEGEDEVAAPPAASKSNGPPPSAGDKTAAPAPAVTESAAIHSRKDLSASPAKAALGESIAAATSSDGSLPKKPVERQDTKEDDSGDEFVDAEE